MKPKLRSVLLMIGGVVFFLAACSFQNPESIPNNGSAPISEEEDITGEPNDEEPAPIGGKGTTALDAFLIPLLDALSQSPPNYDTLQDYMNEDFWIFEPFSAEDYSPAEAVAAFGANYLPSTAAITYNLEIDPATRVTFPLPDEMDVYVYTSGWVDGSQMGVLLIKFTPEDYEWVGVYIGPDKDPDAEPIRIEFDPGATGANVMGSLPANGLDEYLLYALEGQTMTVTVSSPGDGAKLSIAGLSDGLPLVRAASDATSWTGVLPMSQDYSIKVVSSGNPIPSYQMDIEIPPLDESKQSDVVWIPLPDGICQDIEVMVAGELGTTDIGLNSPVPFEDYLESTKGVGCLIQVGGTGVDFSNHGEVFMQLKNMLITMGWTPDPKYDGGGPTGTLGAFRRDMGLILVEVGWEPSEDADCPQDQPISACNLEPEQQIYTIKLSAAMK